MPKIHIDQLPQFTSPGNYSPRVPWKTLRRNLEDFCVNMDPDFQRGHVWTQEQQIAYVEFRLRGGTTGQDVFLNNPLMGRAMDNRTLKPEEVRELDISVIVDGKQRITAALAFVEGEFSILKDHTPGGYYWHEIEGLGPMPANASFNFHVNGLLTRAEVLRWYLELNTGGVVHTPEEIARVKAMYEETLRG